ncbi:hypothetical protein AG0111_0g12083 [Alternaria gaisen]|uniref:Uncharacterized protein n=1 Tax=Alternaria gaisen TaxID=167740 RepID=A0ACB6F5H0_9PLEO|nr:hypothetical protein AG0111_0g12083 [Alternaria gaisen]
MQAASFESQEPTGCDGSLGPIHIDTSQATLTIRPQPESASESASGLHKAPLAPKQGLGSVLTNARRQDQSPISGTYALRTPRGKITSIACESCRKRKSKCDGVRPECNTCQSKNLMCVYDVAQDGKTTTQLRAHLRRLAQELEDMRSIVSLLAMAPDRASAVNWATELEKNGFTNHSAEEIKKALSVRTFEMLPREQSQTALRYPPENATDGTAPMNPSPLDLEVAAKNASNKFRFHCAYYQRTRRELLTRGWSEVQVFGRSEIDVDTILRGFLDPQDTQPVSTWCSRTVNKMLPTTPLPVRLALAYVFTKLMRYLIWPSAENMNANPDWLMPPVGKQDSPPYDILIDLIPWPQVRHLFYQHPQGYPVGALVGLIGVTWPYADDACHYWDIEAGYTRMTPLFESTVADLNNWTIDLKALDVMAQYSLKPVS